MKILVVEDHAPLCELLVRVLNGLGHETQGAISALEALDALENNRFDCIVTDYDLRDRMTGIDIARIAKEKDPNVRILLVSGTPEEYINGCGFDHLIPKPYQPSDILAWVNQ
jgi:CheY-like chemotaxis protein